MGSKSKAIGTRFERSVRPLYEEEKIPCARPQGSSGASLRAMGMTPINAESFSDEVDLVTDFQDLAEAVWQLKSLKTIPEWIYDAPYKPIGVVPSATVRKREEIVLYRGNKKTTISGIALPVPMPLYGGLAVHDGEAHEDYVLLRWPAYIRWMEAYRAFKIEGKIDPDIPFKLTSVALDRVMQELKPRGDRLGRIVRRNVHYRNEKGHLKPIRELAVAVLREADFYQPFGL